MTTIYPPHVLACAASMALILRARDGQLPQADFFAAWNALDDPDAYEPAEETRAWLQSHWREVVPSSDGPPAVVPPPELAEPWMAEFLATFIKTGNISKAALVADISRGTFYNYRDGDPEFARALNYAREERKDLLRESLDDRAVNGWLEPVIGSIGDYRDGQLTGADGKPLFIRKFDNRLAIRVGEANLEEYAKTKAGGDINVQAISAATATAMAVVSAPEKLRNLQARKNRQLVKAAQRGQLPPPSKP